MEKAWFEASPIVFACRVVVLLKLFCIDRRIVLCEQRMRSPAIEGLALCEELYIVKTRRMTRKSVYSGVDALIEICR